MKRFFNAASLLFPAIGGRARWVFDPIDTCMSRIACVPLHQHP